MADFVRLTQAQKEQFNDIYNAYGSSYELNESSKLNDEFENAADKLSVEPSGQYVLISKPEVHPQVWAALGKAGIGKAQDFNNGDTNPDYRKARKVDTNLLEALLALLVTLIKSLTTALKGGSGDDGDEQTPKAGRKPRQRPEDSYER